MTKQLFTRNSQTQQGPWQIQGPNIIPYFVSGTRITDHKMIPLYFSFVVCILYNSLSFTKLLLFSQIPYNYLLPLTVKPSRLFLYRETILLENHVLTYFIPRFIHSFSLVHISGSPLIKRTILSRFVVPLDVPSYFIIFLGFV